MNDSDDAVSCFMEGYSCSQSVLSTFSTQFGLNRETALKISSAFGGGMARFGKTCGAVTGAFMVIGLKYGRIIEGDVQANDSTYQMVHEFVNQFKNIYGSITCKKLLGCDISIPEERDKAKNQNLFKNTCPKFVKDAVEILNRIL